MDIKSSRSSPSHGNSGNINRRQRQLAVLPLHGFEKVPSAYIVFHLLLLVKKLAPLYTTNMADHHPLHIVVFPWLAFGHILPFLELSKSLASKRGHLISFISTPRNIQRLPPIPSEISHLINFISFPLPKVEGLPAAAEATSDLAPGRVESLKIAFDGLEQPFRRFLEESAPTPADWIILDFTHHWIPQIAKENGVPCAYFSVHSAATQVFTNPPPGLADPRDEPGQFLVPPPWVPFPSSLAYRHATDARNTFENFYKPNGSGISDMRRCRSTIESSDAMFMRSSMEFEPEWLQLLAQLHKKPVIPVGLLPPSPPPDQGLEKGENNEIVGWLDKQRSRSVVYIAFGSEAVLSDSLTHELAFGLELARVPFVLALRWPESMLPEGFEERTRDFGVIAKGWVPQLGFLAHESVGGFMTHVGWSSIIEGLQFGHPLIMLPIFGDQALIARLMEEKGIGFEIARDGEDGSFTKEAVAEALKLVMVKAANGENPWRKQASEIMGRVFADKDRQQKHMDEFILYLENHRRSQFNDTFGFRTCRISSNDGSFTSYPSGRQ